MEQITNYVKPELLIVAVVLYFLGQAIKKSQTIKGKYIPLINGAVGIVLCGIYVLGTSSCQTGQEIAMAIFTAITQGVLVAGLSTYVDQIIKQSRKTE
ncbi:phage holin family protein [Lacrimispora celerecrescens]|uniref:Holin family Hol44 protein (Superfamily V) n=1 Tax=[Clostridium] celerecrescens 18A TaxID=1286362 RepID=A0A2M8ZAT9_9FIRM|nr:phage holin family protein [Lacrimispora celerecrescens]PJJ30557.1 holin family Hol44 protein (superfamily V) [[Clostridium] celerecrescens 18A]